MISSRALVTGASAGIGTAFARQLAAGGSDLVLVARDEGRLKGLAVELERGHGVTAQVLAADLTSPAGVTAVEDRLRSTADPVDLLVNNAGFGTYGPFTDLPAGGEAREVELNVLAVVRLTSAALPGMRDRGRGGVLNVSSLAGFQPMPGHATYGATKAFVTSFSQALAGELRGTGVTVTAVCPGYTRTEFHERAAVDDTRIPARLWGNAEDVVAAALAGYAQGRPLVVPGRANQVIAAATRYLPRAVIRQVSDRMAR